MARYVITTACTVPAIPGWQPARPLRKGDVVELTAAEVTAITGAGGAMRAFGPVTGLMHDQLGLATGISNGS